MMTHAGWCFRKNVRRTNNSEIACLGMRYGEYLMHGIDLWVGKDAAHVVDFADRNTCWQQYILQLTHSVGFEYRTDSDLEVIIVL